MVARRVLAPLVQVRALAGQPFDSMKNAGITNLREVECPGSIAK